MIKVGQFLSVRLDVLPAEVTDELAGLQDEVPPRTSMPSARRPKRSSASRSTACTRGSMRLRLPLHRSARRTVHGSAMRTPLSRGSPTSSSRSSALTSTGGRHGPCGPAPGGRLAPEVPAGQPPCRRARAARRVRERHARGARLPGRGPQCRDLPRQLQGQPACGRPCGDLEPEHAASPDAEDVSAIRIGDYEAITAAGSTGRTSQRCSRIATASRYCRTASSTPTRTRETCSSRPWRASTRRASPTGS
jgi:hypothetical protein